MSGHYERTRIVDRYERIGSIEAAFSVSASSEVVDLICVCNGNSVGSFKMCRLDAISAAKAILKYYGETA